MEKLYTLKEIQDILKIGRNGALALLVSGKIFSLKVGRLWRVPEWALQKYLRGE